MFQPVQSTRSTPLTNLKFSISSKKKNEVQTNSNALGSENNAIEVEKRELVTHTEGKELKGPDIKTNESAPLVIPMIDNNWRKNYAKIAEIKEEEGKEETETKEISLRDQAKLLLIQESQSLEDDVPLLMRNRIPDECQYKLDVLMRPDDVDYEAVPVDKFGLAMLRGMGWKEGKPIGKTNPKIVLPTIPELRPKGLGLGAGGKRMQSNNETKKVSKRKIECTKILIRNLSSRTSKRDLKEMFATYGEIRKIKLPKNSRSSGDDLRDFGFVDFLHKSTARKAFDKLANGTQLNGRSIRLEWAGKEDKQYGLTSAKKRKEGD